jgi:hypothetical protein
VVFLSDLERGFNTVELTTEHNVHQHKVRTILLHKGKRAFTRCFCTDDLIALFLHRFLKMESDDE